MKRRHLLAGIGGALAAGGFGSRRARASWGAWPEAMADLALPAERTAGRVLELYAYGGLCAWDTFYCRPELGLDDRRYLYAFGADALHARRAACGSSGALTLPFAADIDGAEIHLGPWTAALWDRPDLLARMRVVVMRHDQFPHATAVPLGLTGARLGQAAMAGTGAAVERHFRERDGGMRPRACVLHPGDLSRLDNVQSALSVGVHPGAARPLELPLNRLGALKQLLARPATQGHAAAFDAVVDRYAASHAARLRGPDGAPLQAPELATWAAVDTARRTAPALVDWIPPTVLGIAEAEVCGETGLSIPGLGARLARHLLTAPEPARYALWVDAGLRPTLDGGHDTHRDHLIAAPINYSHSLALLAAAINAPGEADPGKLDLDDTLIAITTEFGRTPQQEDERAGLGHWPSGYVSVLIGGPIAAPAIAGAIDADSGAATAWTSPAELRMALLVALGIYPFDVGGFAAGEVGGAADARAALQRLREVVLGVKA